MSEEMKKEFTSGATSSKERPRYDLIPQIAHEYNAVRFGVGAKFHGDNNYKKGANDDQFIRDRMNHLFEHVQNLIARGLDAEGAPEELGAILCNASILAELRRLRKEQPQQAAPRRSYEPGGILSDTPIARAARGERP